MKKFLTILLALTLVLALFVSCSKAEEKETETEKPATEVEEKPTEAEEEPSEEPAAPTEEEKEEPEEETGVVASITVQAETDWMPYYQAAADRVIAENPGSTIAIKEVGSFDHLETLEQTDATNEDVADVFALPADRLTSLGNKDLLGALDSHKIAEKAGGWDDFDAGLGGLFVIGDEYMAFPYNIETLITFANEANAEAEGIDLSKPIDLSEIEKPANILLPVFDAWFGVALTNSADLALLKQDGDSFVSDLTTDWAELEAGKQAAITALYDYWKLNADSNTTLFDADAGWGYIGSTEQA